MRTRCTVALVLALVASACAPPARFVGTSLPTGSFELVADRCYHTTDRTDDGVPLQGIEFGSESQPGLMLIVAQAAEQPILEANRIGMVGVWQIPGEHRPMVRIPASDCDVFRLSVDRTAPTTTSGWFDVIDIEVSCRTADGGEITGRAHFTGYCAL